MKGMIIIIEIDKKLGKQMNQICPQYISTTAHKRHYYMVQTNKAYEILRELQRKNNGKK